MLPSSAWEYHPININRCACKTCQKQGLCFKADPIACLDCLYYAFVHPGCCQHCQRDQVLVIAPIVYCKIHEPMQERFKMVICADCLKTRCLEREREHCPPRLDENGNAVFRLVRSNVCDATSTIVCSGPGIAISSGNVATGGSSIVCRTGVSKEERDAVLKRYLSPKAKALLKQEYLGGESCNRPK